MSIFNRYMGRIILSFISPFSTSGDLIIPYVKVYANFCTRMDFTEMFVMSFDFTDANITNAMSKGMAWRKHLVLQLLYFALFLIKERIRINPDV